MLAVLISIVLYVLVAISAVSVMGWETLGKSEAPFTDLAFSAFGSKASFLLTVIALFATANTVLMMMLGASSLNPQRGCGRGAAYRLCRVHHCSRVLPIGVLANKRVDAFSQDLLVIRPVHTFSYVNLSLKSTMF